MSGWEKGNIMSDYSTYHWLIVVGLLIYLWLLVKVAKPRPITQRIEVSRGRLWSQTIVAWLCTLVFGVITFGLVISSPVRRSATPGDTAGRLGELTAQLGLPLFFALSVRWTRSLMRKWKAVEASAVGQGKAAPGVT